MPLPHMQRVAEEVLPGVPVVGEERGDASMCLARVAGPAGGHYVAPRPVSPANAGLNVVERERFQLVNHTAVHAPVMIAREDLFTEQ